ncbi:pyocin knob domain-containing protein [Acidovorax sp. BLS4]|uniref:pyocin knob domain-containing protein n=1 Tax=Acidovorax sp. BLS4 TaxID=3273430 RepID=UPI002943696C|nr:pyocin knob domain-containing protein [Paracidovorax avenae]WOI43790.1 pyocin knob domain-containing protein [Paracidovorax avenae]
MATNLVPVPAQSEIPEFPALADRAAGTYNTKAYDWASRWRAVVAPELYQIALSAFANAQIVVSLAGDAASAAGAAAEAKGQAETAAGTATQQAGLAATAKGQAETAAGAAIQQAGLATTAKGQAEAAAGTATQQAGLAATARQGSETARDQAVSAAAFGFTANSTTNHAVGLGAKTFAIELNKSFVQTQYVSATKRGDPTVKMSGTVSSHDRTTGAIEITVTSVSSAGTANADWVIALAADGGAAGIQTIPSGAYTNANSIPLNSITWMTVASSGAVAANMPLLEANSANSANNGYNTAEVWTVETFGYLAGAENTVTQYATPHRANGVSSPGLKFVRTRVSGAWGRWKPLGDMMPANVVTTATAGQIYGSANSDALNRVNILASALQSAAWQQQMPTNPQNLDRMVLVNNSRSDNKIIASDKPIRGNAVNVAAGETLAFDIPYTEYTFVFYKDLDFWMVR